MQQIKESQGLIKAILVASKDFLKDCTHLILKQMLLQQYALIRIKML